MQTVARRINRKTRSAALVEALEQRIAPAGVFKWNLTGGGNWNNAANWTLVSGDIGAGFPSLLGDEALLGNSITQNSAITIPDGVEITLSKLTFNDNNSYTIGANGSGRLVMRAADTATIAVETSSGSATHTIQAPIHLLADLNVDTSSAQPLVIQTGISQAGPSRDVIKTGTGRAEFVGAAPNTYQGETQVREGTLLLGKNDGFNAVGSGIVRIGNTEGGNTARVVLAAVEQIPDTGSVSVMAGGELDLANFTETVQVLGVYDTGVATTGTGTLVTGTIAAGRISGGNPTISGFVELTGSAQIAVYDFGGETTLNLNAVLKGTQGFQKLGGGTLKLGTSVAQQYTGQSRIMQGTVIVSSATSDAGISNDIHVGPGATLRVENAFEIPDAATVTIEGGRFEVAAFEDFSHLILKGGTVEIEEGATFSIRPNGTVTVPTEAGRDGSEITGAGSFRFLQNGTVVDVGQTGDDVDLRITANMIGNGVVGGLSKAGIGKLALDGNGTFAGNINVSAGIVAVAGTQVATVNMTGGRIEASSFSAKVGGITGSGGKVQGGEGLSSESVLFSPGLTFAAICDGFGNALMVEGTVDLGGATLEATLLNLSEFGGVFTIVENDGNDAVSGTFAGLPEGGTVVTPRGNFTISYVGGTGNDVTLTPVFVEPVIGATGKTASYKDVDGDNITVSVTKGTLTASNFKLLAAGDGARLIDLKLSDPMYSGANVKVAAKGAGDGRADVITLTSDVNLGTISIGGDLGSLTVGSQSAKGTAFKSLSALSFGYSREVASLGSTYVSSITGAIGTFKVKGNVVGANIQISGGGVKSGAIQIGGSLLPGAGNEAVFLSVTGEIAKVAIDGDVVGGISGPNLRVTGGIKALTIGGSIVGGTGTNSGLVQLNTTSAAAIMIGRDIIGGAGNNSGNLELSGSVANLKIGGSIAGGDGSGSGSVSVTENLKTLTIGRDLRGGAAAGSGAVEVGKTLQTTKIGGSLLGGTGGSGLFAERFGTITIGRDLAGTSLGRATIAAAGLLNPADASAATVIGSLTVGRDVQHADVLAGYSKGASAINPDVQIGKVTVKGEWVASNLAAGIESGDGVFGNADDAIIAGGSQTIVARIAGITIGGQVRGTVTSGDSFGFVAQEFGKMSVAGKKVLLDPANKDTIILHNYEDIGLREL